jgi:tripartite-type tricarboxylate transporter receptor subunit TctC
MKATRLFAVLISLVLPVLAMAQPYPTRPITFVVPYPPAARPTWWPA